MAAPAQASSGALYAQFGLSVANSLISAWSTDQQISAQKKVDKANAYAANTLRDGQNELAAARNALANYTKSVNNQRAMQVGGDTLNVLTQNFARAMDQSLKGSMQQQLRASEEVGATAAAAAWAGVGGSSVRMVQQTQRLKHQWMQDEVAKARDYQNYDFKQQRSQVGTSMAQSLDYTLSMAGMDYGTTQVPFRATPNMFGAAFAGADWAALRDGMAGNIPDKANVEALGFKSPVTSVSSPAFNDAVSKDFFSFGTGANYKL